MATEVSGPCSFCNRSHARQVLLHPPGWGELWLPEAPGGPTCKHKIYLACPDCHGQVTHHLMNALVTSTSHAYVKKLLDEAACMRKSVFLPHVHKAVEVMEQLSDGELLEAIKQARAARAAREEKQP